MFSFRFLFPAVAVAVAVGVTITPSLCQAQGQATSTTPTVIGVPGDISTFGWGNYRLTAGHSPTISSTITLEQIAGPPTAWYGNLFNFTSSGMLSLVLSFGKTTLCLGPMYNSTTGYNPNVDPFKPHPNPGPNRIILYACDDKDDNQQWVWNKDTTTIQHTFTGWCLDAVWLPVILTPCNTNFTNQHWSLPTQPACPSLNPYPNTNPSPSTSHDAWLVSSWSSSSSTSSSWLVPVLASFLGASLVLLGVVSVMLYRYMKLAQQTKHIKIHTNMYTQQP